MQNLKKVSFMVRKRTWREGRGEGRTEVGATQPQEEVVQVTTARMGMKSDRARQTPCDLTYGRPLKNKTNKTGTDAQIQRTNQWSPERGGERADAWRGQRRGGGQQPGLGCRPLRSATRYTYTRNGRDGNANSTSTREKKRERTGEGREGGEEIDGRKRRPV